MLDEVSQEKAPVEHETHVDNPEVAPETKADEVVNLLDEEGDSTYENQSKKLLSNDDETDGYSDASTVKLSSGDSSPPAVKEYTDDQKQDYMELFGTGSAEDVTSHVGGNPESVAVRSKETSAVLMALIMKNRKRKLPVSRKIQVVDVGDTRVVKEKKYIKISSNSFFMQNV